MKIIRLKAFSKKEENNNKKKHLIKVGKNTAD